MRYAAFCWHCKTSTEHDDHRHTCNQCGRR